MATAGSSRDRRDAAHDRHLTEASVSDAGVSRRLALLPALGVFRRRANQRRPFSESAVSSTIGRASFPATCLWLRQATPIPVARRPRDAHQSNGATVVQLTVPGRCRRREQTLLQSPGPINPATYAGRIRALVLCRKNAATNGASQRCHISWRICHPSSGPSKSRTSHDHQRRLLGIAEVRQPLKSPK